MAKLLLLKLTAAEKRLLAHSLGCTLDEYTGADMPHEAKRVHALARTLGLKPNALPVPPRNSKEDCLSSYREGMRDAWQVIAKAIQTAGADYGLAVSNVLSPASDAHCVPTKPDETK